MRVRDPALLQILHLSPTKECALCGTTDRLELHHVLPRSQSGDDVRENLVFLCASEHELITHNDRATRKALGRHVALERPDVERYILDQLGWWIGRDWFERRLFLDT